MVIEMVSPIVYWSLKVMKPDSSVLAKGAGERILKCETEWLMTKYMRSCKSCFIVIF
jgi:hypothetical protein